MKKLSLFLVFLFSATLCFSAPSTTISIPNSFTPNTTISSSAMNSNFNTVQTTFNSHTHEDITKVGAITSGTWQGNVVEKTYGGTGVTTGIGLPSGAVFFMISGSCPTGTTDVSATYANKFVKINATAGTSAGTVLTGTSDSHTLTSTEMPAHVHRQITRGPVVSGAGPAGGGNDSVVDSGNDTLSTGGGGGHTHTLSAATTLEPSSITMTCCQVD